MAEKSGLNQLSAKELLSSSLSQKNYISSFK
jgi:hypothetical protein